MAQLTVSQCLEPPHGTGDLPARALWPEAFTATGAGIADVEAAVTVYLAEGYLRVSAANQTDEARGNESARQWVRHRAFRQRYENAITGPSSVGSDEGWSGSMTGDQIAAIGLKADEALALSDALLDVVPVEEESGSYKTIRSLR